MIFWFLAAAVAVGLFLRWLTKTPDPDFLNVLTEAEAVEKRLVSDAKSAAGSFKSRLDARTDPGPAIRAPQTRG